MVKHNNVLPNVHFHKWWQRYVKTWFNQAGRKKSRRLARQEKASKTGMCTGLLRPEVHGTTQRYNMKIREGRGFTLEELKVVGISHRVALSIGISVDHRRRNRSAESLNANVFRLKDYLGKLVIFQRGSKAKKGTGGIPADTIKPQLQNFKQVRIMKTMPIVRADKKIQSRGIFEDERKVHVYGILRKARRDAHNVGKRRKNEEEK